MIQSIFFYTLSAALVVSAIMVVTQRSVFTCALYLAVVLSAVAGFFVLLSADFLAAVQILVYVGGILVILIFAVMLSSVQQSKLLSQTNEQRIPSLLGCLAVFFMILIAVKRTGLISQTENFAPTTRSIGKLLFGEMVLPFEVVSLILLAALVGAVIFSKREPDESSENLPDH